MTILKEKIAPLIPIPLVLCQHSVIFFRLKLADHWYSFQQEVKGHLRIIKCILGLKLREYNKEI